MNNFSDNIKKITGDTSNWRENVQYRKNNKWLKYSSQIARRILAVIEDRKDLNQAKLAQAVNVSPQQISKIVQGQENLTLETIYKLSEALGVELISFPEYKYSTARNGYKEPLFTPSTWYALKGVATDSASQSPNKSVSTDALVEAKPELIIAA